MADSKKRYPRTGDTQTVYLQNVVTNPNIEVGAYTMYNDFYNDPAGQNSFSIAPIIRQPRRAHILFRFFMKNGGWKKRMWQGVGIIKAIL